MPNTNKNRIKVAEAAVEVVKLWKESMWVGDKLIIREEALIKAVEELERA